MSNSRQDHIEISLDMSSPFGQCHLKGNGIISNDSIKANELKLEKGSFGCPSTIQNFNLFYTQKNAQLLKAKMNMDTPYGHAKTQSDVELDTPLNHSSAFLKYTVKETMLGTTFSGSIKKRG